MRVEVLFLRWLLVIAMVALVVGYARSSRSASDAAQYETIPLIIGGKSSGLPLAGIAVDPTRRDVYAIVGGPAQNEATPRQFCLVWKGREGKLHAATFPSEGATPMFEVSATGDVQVESSGSRSSAKSDARTADAESTLRSILQALPAEPTTR